MVGQAWLYIWVIEKQGSPFPTLTRWSAISKHFLSYKILSIYFIVELMGRHLLYCGTDLGEACLELFLFHILPPCSVCASTCFSVEQHLARGTKFDHCTAWEGVPAPCLTDLHTPLECKISDVLLQDTFLCIFCTRYVSWKNYITTLQQSTMIN